MATKRYYICSRLWKPGCYYFVRELPGEGGADWGYTEKSLKARPLSTYWKRRFEADMRRVGATGVNCREVIPPQSSEGLLFIRKQSLTYARYQNVF